MHYYYENCDFEVLAELNNASKDAVLVEVTDTALLLLFQYELLVTINFMFMVTPL
ncbi:MAG: hypothetical protein ACM3X7_10915 [Solirubrobacterales bacterium]